VLHLDWIDGAGVAAGFWSSLKAEFPAALTSRVQSAVSVEEYGRRVVMIVSFYPLSTVFALSLRIATWQPNPLAGRQGVGQNPWQFTTLDPVSSRR
jgi:hypothetical protein